MVSNIFSYLMTIRNKITYIFSPLRQYRFNEFIPTADIIKEVSKKLADKVMGTEQELIKRAPMIDGNILDVVQEIGRQTYKRVLEQTKDQIVEKKRKKD